MDELITHSSLFPPSPPSQLFCTTGDKVLEFMSQDVPDQWLFDDIVASKNEARELCPSQTILPGGSQIPELWPSLPRSPQRPSKRRGRKPGSSPNGQSANHVQAERLRRDKLNRRFCDLRAAVPTVSRMDKASLLADAVTYIMELRSHVARLEDNSKAAAAKFEQVAAASPHGPATFLLVDEAVEVRMMGRDAAAVRLTTAASHAPARLMGALRALDLQVQQACVTRVRGMTVQDVIVDVPTTMPDDDGLRSALLQRLQDSTS
ncbi:unnamed protein product [Alopecurus aequalis]